MSRAAVDDIARQVLHAKVPLVRTASSSARPGNYREVGEDFLHEFYTYQTADFFAEPPTVGGRSPGWSGARDPLGCALPWHPNPPDGKAHARW